MTELPKILWHSNAPYTNTGYGQQTALFTARLRDHYKLAISCFFGLEGASINWNGIPLLPGLSGSFGNDTIQEHAGVFFDSPRDGFVMTLMDVWVLDPQVWRSLNVASWVPVDHDPVPRPVTKFFDESGAVPIAMSKFGQEQLTDYDPLYVPHAVDTEVYKPKPDTRKGLGLPEQAFIVGMVSANKGSNPSRKCFPEAFRAFKAFRDTHPEARLYLNTEMTGRFDGIDLPRTLVDSGVALEDVFFCDQYRAVHLPLPPERMADCYSAMDVLLMPSAGEGFGVPALEAQACGVPVIGSDFSAQPEVIGAGWLVEGQPFYTSIGSWQIRPDIEDITEALTRAYGSAADPECAKRAREHALQYDVERVMAEHMLPALAEVAERFDLREPVTLPPREAAVA